MIGRTISHYRIVERVGRGGMGIVFRAEDTRLHRSVALKFLPAEIGSDEDAKERFILEARAASALQHNTICTIHDIDTAEDGQLFICMDFYDGEVLSSKVEKGPLPTEEILDIVAQIADGLDAAHEKGIIHRDIKPANIMITADGGVKILDFGIAKFAGRARLTKTGKSVGTSAYMSPEQARGEELDGRSDIFSLGALTYELLTGRLPFKGDHEAAILYSIIHSDPEPLDTTRPDVPERLARIVGKMLKKDPADRYQSVEELKRDLHEVRESLGSDGDPASRGEVSRRGAGVRHGGGSLKPFLFVAVTVVVAVLAWYVATQRSGTQEPADLTGVGIESEPNIPQRVTLRQVTFDAGVEEYPALSPDGNNLAYCMEVNGFRELFLKDLENGQVDRLTRTASDNIQPSWSPDGETIVFTRSNRDHGKLEPGDVFGVHFGGDVWMLTLSSGKEMKIIDDAYNPAFSPDGKQLAFDASWGGPRRIWIADHLGRNPQQISSDPSEAASHIIPRWSADGSKIVFQNKVWTKWDIKIVDVASGGMTTVTDDVFQDLNPVWSPSGSAILFSSYRSGGLNVWRITLGEDGSPVGSPEPVTTGAGQDVQLAVCQKARCGAMSVLNLNADLWRLPVDPKTGLPTGQPEPLIATTREDSRGSWSPDGTRIAFNSDRTGDMNIWIYSNDDGSVTQITSGPGGDFQPEWSRDGEQLVFFSSRSGNADIWLVDVLSREMKQLTGTPALDINPFFSPDGKHIAYQSDHDGRKEVWVMKADGTGHRQLTRTGVGGHFMLWVPRSDAVVYSAPGSRTLKVSIDGGEPEPFCENAGGAHMSFSPAGDAIMDVSGHKKIWVTPIETGDPIGVLEFDDPDVRIDYPVWSPDGYWVLFDRMKPAGGDIWLIEDLE